MFSQIICLGFPDFRIFIQKFRIEVRLHECDEVCLLLGDLAQLLVLVVDCLQPLLPCRVDHIYHCLIIWIWFECIVEVNIIRYMFLDLENILCRNLLHLPIEVNSKLIIALKLRGVQECVVDDVLWSFNRIVFIILLSILALL
jgi:hypothetical protein